MCPVCGMLQHPANRTHNPQLLMMGIMVSETCSAKNKFCNKETNLLHLVGILISTYFHYCLLSLTFVCLLILLDVVTNVLFPKLAN